MKDKHKPLAQTGWILIVLQASPVLWPLEHPCLYSLLRQCSFILQASACGSQDICENERNISNLCVQGIKLYISQWCTSYLGPGLRFSFTQVHCRASCFWRKKWWGRTTILSGWHGLSHTHDWLARVSLKEVKWDLDTGRRELRWHQVKNRYSHTQLPLFSHPKFRMDSITPQWPGY